MATPKDKVNTNLTLIGVLLIALGLGGGYEFVVPRLTDALTSYQQTADQEAAKSQDVKDLKSAELVLGQVRSTLAAEGVDLNRVSQAFPATEEIPNLYIQMEALTTNRPGISNASYEIGKPISAGGYVQVPVTVKATGTYPDLVTYLDNLENAIRPLSFTLINFSTAVASSGSSPNTPPPPSNQMVLSASGQVWAAGLSPAYNTSQATGGSPS